MQKFILHEPVAQGWFNLGKSSSVASTNAWETDLCSTDAVLELLMTRLLSDFESLAPRMRKAWSSKEVEPCLPFRPFRQDTKFFVLLKVLLELRSPFTGLAVPL